MVLTHDIEKGRIPCVYRISLVEKEDNQPLLIVRVQEGLVRKYLNTKSIGLIEGIKKRFDFEYFSSFSEPHFGFNGVFKKEESRDGFMEFVAPIPTIKQEIAEVCGQCGGTGQDDLRDSDCLICHGFGKKSSYRWKPLQAILATLSFLLAIGEVFNERSPVSCIQLMTFRLSFGEEGQYFIGGSYSPDFCKWLAGHPSHQFSGVVGKMRKIYGYIYQKDEDFYYFNVRSSGGNLVIECPGNATSICPNDFNDYEKGYAVRFGCTNVDTSAQQLVLLIGLILMWDKAEQELIKSGII